MLKVRDLMVPCPRSAVLPCDVFTVPADATVSDAARRMIDGACRRLLVVQEGEPVGLLTADELVGAVADGQLTSHAAPRGHLLLDEL